MAMAEGTVKYSLESKSLDNSVGKIKLFYEDGSEGNIRITGYSKKNGDTIEVGYEEGPGVADFSELTLFLDGVTYPPKVILRNEGAKGAAFSDLPENPEFKESIKVLYDKGIINGYKDGTFKPNNTVTRAEFAKMLTTAAQYKIEEGLSSTFNDVKNTSWAKDYIMTLVNKGVIKGKAEGIYAPSDLITLGEGLTILNRTFDIDIKSGMEMKQVKHWSYENMSAMYKANVFREGDELYENLVPNKKLTRAECSLFLSRVFETRYTVR